jgi:hypothetical protein
MATLLFKALAQLEPSGLEIDAGRRFTLWFGNPQTRHERIARAALIYVRWVGTERSKLLSFDLDVDTGYMFCCELILYKRGAGEPCVKDQDVRTDLGMPLFEVKHLPLSSRFPRIVDLKQEFGLEVLGNKVRISLLGGELAYKVKCGTTSFGFDSENGLILLETYLNEGQTLSF